MKSFATFRENLQDRRLQLLRKQKAQKQQSAEAGDKARASFEKEVDDKREATANKERKMREKEEIKQQVKRELESEE